MLANMLYKLHIHDKENEILHVINYEWKYINMVNSSFFLVGIYRDENCIYRVKTANSGKEC